MITETIYSSRDNSIDLLLKSDSSGALAAQDLSAVTRMILQIGTEDDPDSIAEIDSNNDDTIWDWETGTTGKVIIELGGQGITAGTNYLARLIVYGPDYANGIVWGYFRLDVKE